MRVGIYSGSFDPVHKGHLGFAISAIDDYKIDKVFFMPEPRPRRKQGVKAFEHRCKMIDLAIKDNPKLGTIILDQKKFLVSETLPVLLERFKGAEIYMLIGDDMLDHFLMWPNVEDLISEIKFIIATRKYTERHIKDVVENISIATGFKFKCKIIEGQNSDISSRKIRENIKKLKDYSGLNPSVSEYVKVNNLYSTAEK